MMHVTWKTDLPSLSTKHLLLLLYVLLRTSAVYLPCTSVVSYADSTCVCSIFTALLHLNPLQIHWQVNVSRPQHVYIYMYIPVSYAYCWWVHNWLWNSYTCTSTCVCCVCHVPNCSVRANGKYKMHLVKSQVRSLPWYVSVVTCSVSATCLVKQSWGDLSQQEHTASRSQQGKSKERFRVLYSISQIGNSLLTCLESFIYNMLWCAYLHVHYCEQLSCE